MIKEPRLTGGSLEILKHLMDNPTKGLCGSDLSKITGIGSGTLYPTLIRLEKAGWLKSDWEKQGPEHLGRPRRRYYFITALGQNKATEHLGKLQVNYGDAAWARSSIF